MRWQLPLSPTQVTPFHSSKPPTISVKSYLEDRCGAHAASIPRAPPLPRPTHLPGFAPRARWCACAPAWHMLHTHAGPCLFAGYHPRMGHTHGVAFTCSSTELPSPALCLGNRRAFSDARRGARRILKYAGCSEETFILALIYMDQARARPALPRPPARAPALARWPALRSGDPTRRRYPPLLPASAPSLAAPPPSPPPRSAAPPPADMLALTRTPTPTLAGRSV